MADIEDEGRITSAWLPAPRGFTSSLRSSLKEIFLPDDPFRQLNGKTSCEKTFSILRYFFPILEWASKYNLGKLKADLVSGITITSLAIPQGISYANLASIPPVIGLYSGFVPPLIYAVLGSSKSLAIGTVATSSLLLASTITPVVSPTENPDLYLNLVFTSTLISGILQAALGIFRLGILIDFLPHATIVGFMGGTATIIILQQLKGMFGLVKFTRKTDIISVLCSVFSQTHHWQWQSALMGILFLIFLLTTRYISKKKPQLFWISAISPLVCVVLGSVIAYVTDSEHHGIPIVGMLNDGINPVSVSRFQFHSQYFGTAVKAGILTGFVALVEGIAVGRSLAIFTQEEIDGNKEMLAFGVMNIVGSCTSCYITTGPLSKSAVNHNTGCKTAASNIVTSIAMMLTLLFLTRLFRYIPLVVLSAIIIAAVKSMIHIGEACHLFGVDKFDFLICIAAFFGVIFISIDVGIMISAGIAIVKTLLYMARPGTTLLGRMPKTKNFIDMQQYPKATRVPGIIMLHLGSPIYFPSAAYLKQRIWRWVNEEEEYIANNHGTGLSYLILDMSGLTNIDTSGINMLRELKKSLDKREIKLALTIGGVEVMEKLTLSNFVEFIGPNWIFPSLADAVSKCQFMLHDAEQEPNLDRHANGHGYVAANGINHSENV